MSSHKPATETDRDTASLYDDVLKGRALVPVSPERQERDQNKVRSGFWPKVRTTIGKVPFVEDAVAAYFCAMDRNTPVWVRATLMGALAYFVVPADMIPDFVAGLGFTDDATVILAALRTISGHMSDEHRARAQDALSDSSDAELDGPANSDASDE
ncbi:YkvA family protein [Pelagibius sp. Alg239-R121]|uniref:YkvA family protein n=1 Tax=Pelagibius sp. Alg239-R121 TaxID=2993448 RepID=UPI0024A76072|nr:YkvA family protein [Pelagibius sp. Alg239-R121]